MRGHGEWVRERDFEAEGVDNNRGETAVHSSYC